jgi:hypothetical protein
MELPMSKKKTTDTMRAAKATLDRQSVNEDAAYTQQGNLSVRQQKPAVRDAVSRFLRGQ